MGENQTSKNDFKYFLNFAVDNTLKIGIKGILNGGRGLKYSGKQFYRELMEARNKNDIGCLGGAIAFLTLGPAIIGVNLAYQAMRIIKHEQGNIVKK